MAKVFGDGSITIAADGDRAVVYASQVEVPNVRSVHVDEVDGRLSVTLFTDAVDAVSRLTSGCRYVKVKKASSSS